MTKASPKRAAKKFKEKVAKKKVGILEKPQFQLNVTESGKLLSRQPLHDPFHNTTIKVKGWRAAWAVLTKGIDYVIQIGGTREAQEVVFNGDYKELPPIKQVAIPNATEEVKK